MPKSISYLGFFVIPIVSVLLVFFALYGHFVRHQRLATQMTLHSQLNELTVKGAHVRRGSARLEVSTVASQTKTPIITWTRPLSVATEFYDRIEMTVRLPEHYRGLDVIVQTASGEERLLPVLYDVDGVASLHLATFFPEASTLMSLRLSLKHELLTPMTIESIRIVPKTLTVPLFARMILKNLVGQYALIVPLLVYVLITLVMMLLLWLVYRRVLGSLVCVFSSLAITLVAMSGVTVVQLGMTLQTRASHTVPILHDAWLDAARKTWQKTWLDP